MTSLALYKVSKLKPSYSASAKVFMGNSNDMLDIYSQDELSYYSQFKTISYGKMKYFYNTDKVFYIDEGSMISLGGGFALFSFIIGKIKDEDLGLLDFIKPGQHFKFIK